MNQLKSVGKALQKINLAHLIDEMEKQQEIAYQLEHINEENIAEVERREMVDEAVAACKKAMEDHLHGFLKNCNSIDNSNNNSNSNSGDGNDDDNNHRYVAPVYCYEEWIKQLHPESAEFEDDRIDHRYYTEDSDHRHMWNECMMEEEIDCPERIVDARHILPSYNRKQNTEGEVNINTNADANANADKGADKYDAGI